MKNETHLTTLSNFLYSLYVYYTHLIIVEVQKRHKARYKATIGRDVRHLVKFKYITGKLFKNHIFHKIGLPALCRCINAIKMSVGIQGALH